jgi:hypothetical protein
LIELREDDLHENGHDGYTGSWGQSWGKVAMRDKTFDNANAACAWLERNCEKRGRVLGVYYRLPSKRTERQEAKVAKLRAKVTEANEKHSETCRKIIAAFYGRKSKLVSCSCCGSKLSREHLGKRLGSYALPKCPLCSTVLLSETDQNRIKASEARVSKARKALDEGSKLKPSSKIVTMIGFCAAS